jgi:hypothetical protein
MDVNHTFIIEEDSLLAIVYVIKQTAKYVTISAGAILAMGVLASHLK